MRRYDAGIHSKVLIESDCVGYFFPAKRTLVAVSLQLLKTSIANSMATGQSNKVF